MSPGAIGVTTLPMLADFAIRLASGLALMLVVAPWRWIPPSFFRTHCVVILGLLVLGIVDECWVSLGAGPLSLTVTLAVLAYVGSVVWGLGLPKVGVPVSGLMVAVGVGLLIWGSWDARPALWGLNTAGRLASSLLLGSTLTAMLLGHHYLNTPTMSIAPLRRFVGISAMSLVARAGLGALGLWLWVSGTVGGGSTVWSSILFLGMRWGMGVAGPALATFLAWKTVQIRSTQSATGILYIAMTLVLFGELTALILSRTVGVVL